MYKNALIIPTCKHLDMYKTYLNARVNTSSIYICPTLNMQLLQGILLQNKAHKAFSYKNVIILLHIY